MTSEIVDWFQGKGTTSRQELQRREERNRQRGPTLERLHLETPSAPEDWADDNTDTVGEGTQTTHPKIPLKT